MARNKCAFLAIVREILAKADFAWDAWRMGYEGTFSATNSSGFGVLVWINRMVAWYEVLLWNDSQSGCSQEACSSTWLWKRCPPWRSYKMFLQVQDFCMLLLPTTPPAVVQMPEGVLKMTFLWQRAGIMVRMDAPAQFEYSLLEIHRKSFTFSADADGTRYAPGIILAALS
jgi:hypothetical protein